MTEFDLSCARLARFYGWTHEQILSLPYSSFHRYYLAIGNVLAEEKLHAAEIAMIPKMKNTKRSKVWQRLKKEVAKHIYRPRVDSDEQFMEKISRMMQNG